MRTLKMFFLVLLFLAADMSVAGFWGMSAANAEEVMQLARLSPRRKFVRRVSPANRLRTKLQANKNKGFVRKVFAAPRGVNARQDRELSPHRFVPRRPVVSASKKLASSRNGALGESHAVVNSLREKKREIRKQFSTRARRGAN